jgi:3-deoxy-D-manno-octulosonate 8-phosphate phosphatase (KDO 8-P phosphatase)
MARDIFAGVRMVVCSVDGVLTDGSVTYESTATDIRTFHVRDGLATRLAAWNDLPIAWISARIMNPVKRRAEEMLARVYPGMSDKAAGLRIAARDAGVDLRDVAYVGYDLNDIPAMRLAGLPIAVRGAAPEIAAIAGYTTETPGGSGALREVVERVFRSQGQWEQAVDVYLEHLRCPCANMDSMAVES